MRGSLMAAAMSVQRKSCKTPPSAGAAGAAGAADAGGQQLPPLQMPGSPSRLKDALFPSDSANQAPKGRGAAVQAAAAAHWHKAPEHTPALPLAAAADGAVPAGGTGGSGVSLMPGAAIPVDAAPSVARSVDGPRQGSPAMLAAARPAPPDVREEEEEEEQDVDDAMPDAPPSRARDVSRKMSKAAGDVMQQAALVLGAALPQATAEVAACGTVPAPAPCHDGDRDADALEPAPTPAHEPADDRTHVPVPAPAREPAPTPEPHSEPAPPAPLTAAHTNGMTAAGVSRRALNGHAGNRAAASKASARAAAASKRRTGGAAVRGLRGASRAGVRGVGALAQAAVEAGGAAGAVRCGRGAGLAAAPPCPSPQLLPQGHAGLGRAWPSARPSVHAAVPRG